MDKVQINNLDKLLMFQEHILKSSQSYSPLYEAKTDNKIHTLSTLHKTQITFYQPRNYDFKVITRVEICTLVWSTSIFKMQPI
jgi:hypothetical protein